MHIHFGLKTKNDEESSVILKIKYKSEKNIQIYYYQTWNTIAPLKISPINIVQSNEWKEATVNLPLKNTFTNLLFNLGQYDSINTPLIKYIELDISGTKLLFTKESLAYLIKRNNFILNSDGKITRINNNTQDNIILETIDLTQLFTKYKSETTQNIFITILLSLILTVVSILILYHCKKWQNNIKLLTIPLFIRKNYLSISVLLFIILSIFSITFYSKNEVDYLMDLKTNDSINRNKELKNRFEIFNKIDHNPKNNLLYNGNFQHDLFFWKIGADSTFVNLINTPYGKGVKIIRTDGDGGYWSFLYVGRPIIYYPNHTYKITFKCKVIKGNGFPFHIGWWVLDGNPTHKAAFLPKMITNLGNKWVEINLQYTFNEKHEGLIFFLNSLKDFSEIEITDIKLIDLNFDPKKPCYSK